MKKKIIILGGILIVLIAGSIFLIRQKIKSNNLKYRDYTTRASVKALFNMNVSQKCTVRPQGKLREGNVIVGGGKLRGDFRNSSSGGGHIVIDRDFVWTWTDTSNLGAKIPLPSFRLDQSADTLQWKCESAIPDKSAFDLPQNINFSQTE